MTEIFCRETNKTYYIAIEVNTTINQKWLETREQLEDELEKYNREYYVDEWEFFIPTGLKLGWHFVGKTEDIEEWNELREDELEEVNFLNEEICNLINFDWEWDYDDWPGNNENTVGIVETVADMNKIIDFFKGYETTTNGEYRFTVK